MANIRNIIRDLIADRIDIDRDHIESAILECDLDELIADAVAASLPEKIKDMVEEIVEEVVDDAIDDALS